jgi:F0F1-type ATP synthase assembly protein I
VHTDDNNTRTGKFPFRFGFLVAGILWGGFLGYAIAEWPSSQIGYHWYENPYPSYFIFTIIALIAAPIIGFFIGIILDHYLQTEQIRRNCLECIWMTLLIVVIIYALMAPAMMSVR